MSTTCIFYVSLVTLLLGQTCPSYESPLLLLEYSPRGLCLREFLLNPRETRLTTDQGGPHVDLETISTVMDACWRVLWYFWGNVAEVNLDAAFATRLADAQFQMLTRALEEEVQSDTSIELQETMTALFDLRDLSARVSDIAESTVMISEPEFYEQLGRVLKRGFWEVPLETRHINSSAQRDRFEPSSRRVLAGVEQLVEYESDNCLSEELGTSCGEERKECAQCDISEKCFRTMTQPGYSGYSLTHQAFYITIGLQAGCGEELQVLTSRTKRGATIRDLLDRFCTDIYTEAQVIADSKFPVDRRDLFMEQGALCGIVGYSDFFRRDWLTHVLSWQRDMGCFGNADVFNSYHKDSPLHSRVRRAEKEMPGKCLAHQSAVALGYLSLYLRFLVSEAFM